MSSLAEQLAELLDPSVKSIDPEDDIYEETKAKVVEKDDLDEDENGVQHVPKIGRRKMQSLEGMGEIYRGKVISRNQTSDGDQTESDFDEDEDIELKNGIGSEDDDEVQSEDESAQHSDSESDMGMNGVNLSDGDDGMDEEIDSDEADGGDDDGNLRIFENNKKSDPMLKSKATRNQFCLWENMLEARIKCQKILTISNKLPQSVTMESFKNSLSTSLLSTDKILSSLLFKLLELEKKLLVQNSDTQSIGNTNNSDKKRKSTTPLEEVNDMIEDRFTSYKTHRNKVLKLWYDKTRLTASSKSKSFSNFERSTVSQIDDILQDRERLIKRTQLKRTNYRILGTSQSNKTENVSDSTSHSSHLKEFIPEIYDDDDFYHQLLRQLIEQKSSGPGGSSDPVELTRQWLKVQRLRSKAKKNVDTKASKGRKIRYEIHQKLQSFMAPNDHADFTHEARNQLFMSLFGNIPESSPEI